jgi:hypothetical protein
MISRILWEETTLPDTMFTGIVEIVGGIRFLVHQSDLSNTSQWSPSSIPKLETAERT